MTPDRSSEGPIVDPIDSTYVDLVEIWRKRAEDSKVKVERLREALAVFAAGKVHGQEIPALARNYAKKVLRDG